MTIPVHIALNEAALGGGRARQGILADDVALLSRLVRTVRHLRHAVAAYDRLNIIFVLPAGISESLLPGGTPFRKAIDKLGADLRALAIQYLTDASWYDDTVSPSWSAFGKSSRGITHAHRHNGLTVSFDVAPWQIAVLPIDLNGEAASVTNAWVEQLLGEHRAALANHVSVLPEYENPGTHDRSSPNYSVGKSVLPRSAVRLLEHAITDDGLTWWARCECTFFHRFQGTDHDGRRVVHWNGTTDPNAERTTSEADVPARAKDRLAAMNPVADCGCHRSD